MRKQFLLFILVLISFSSISQDLIKESIIKQSVHLAHKVSELSNDVQFLKDANKTVFVTSDNKEALYRLESRIAVIESELLRFKNLATKQELSVSEKYLIDRIISAENSISQWANLFSWVGTGWGVLFTFIIFFIGYLHYRKLEDIVSETRKNHAEWLNKEAPRLLKEESQQYVDEIEKLRDNAEKYFLSTEEHFINVKKVSNLRLDPSRAPLQDEELNENVQVAIDKYQQHDFADAILHAKFALEEVVNNRSRIEALQIIINSYLAIKRKDLASSYDEKLSQVASNLAPYDRANTLFTIAMNRYPFDKDHPNESTFSYLDDLISEYLSDENEQIMVTVVKAMHFKAIILENNSNKFLALKVYNEIIERYKSVGNEEIQAIIAICKKNKKEITDG
ncbi:hypothetical protein [Moritella sp. F3]|uniref:hypothetical protein n=1 Tax=Moritella sp. F3 TaxID=2718882 RepID=UPI0018E0E665|nr:hypothetical protein [Moritella sp. F3]GIC75612.1 hypothetical protein FMO001_03390 [Moritella sp. F1]GIC80757.1 hypothetical protein FMO003_10380 [Moritella sp. F3]